MKCPICGKDVDLQKKQVGVDEQGAPVFHQYAVCRDCKKQWDLDKQRARKAAPDIAIDTVKAETPAAKPQKASKEGAADAAARSAAPKKNPSEVSNESRTVRRKSASGQPTSQKVPPENPGRKMENIQAASAGNVPLEKRAPRKAALEEPSVDKMVSRKPVAAESSAEKKAVRKTEGKEPSVAKVPRKSAPGTASPEKKTRNLEGQKATGEKAGGARPVSVKRPSGGEASEKASAERMVSGKAPGERASSGKAPSKNRPDGSARPNDGAVSTGTPKKKPVRKSVAESEEQRYGNIPPEKVRVKKEHAVRQGYEDMLSADPNHKPKKKKRPLPDEEMQPVKKQRSVPEKQRSNPINDREDEYDEDDMEFEAIPAKFHVLRIIFGVISILAAGFFAYGGFFEGLENIASGSTISTGTTFIIFAICMLVSGLLLLIMQNRNTILAFILPMIFYFGAAVFTFLKRQDKQMFLYCAIGSAVLGVVFLVLGIISRNSNGNDNEDDYDDPFDDDYE